MNGRKMQTVVAKMLHAVAVALDKKRGMMPHFFLVIGNKIRYTKEKERNL
jgi:hypothetical protein